MMIVSLTAFLAAGCKKNVMLQVHIDGGACRRAVSVGACSGQSVFLLSCRPSSVTGEMQSKVRVGACKWLRGRNPRTGKNSIYTLYLPRKQTLSLLTPAM
jgi:hypothetical protein